MDDNRFREIPKKRIKMILWGVGIAIVLLIGAVNMPDSSSPSAEVQPQGDVTASPGQTAAEPEQEGVKDTEPAFDWATAEVTEENVRKALADNVGAAMAIPLTDDTFRKFVSSADDKGEYIELTINPGTFWDEKDFVKRAGGSLIAYSKVLFQNPNVYEVSLDVKIDNVAGGDNDAVYISWRRDQAEKADMDAILDNMFGDYTIPFQVARKYSITNEVYDKLKEFDLPKEHNL